MDRGAGAGARTDGGERTPVIKSRPDVLLSEGWKAHASIGRMAKAFGSSLGERRCLGHSGPWPGGWGDIAWVMPLGAVQVVLDATTASRLAPLLLDDAAGDFRTCAPHARDARDTSDASDAGDASDAPLGPRAPIGASHARTYHARHGAPAPGTALS